MYKAFISYKHSKDILSRAFITQLESALKRYAKPLLRPPIRIFRDEVNTSPGADLSSLIRSGLNDSEFLILLASTSAAQSPWVADELRVWFEELQRPEESLIIVLTEGRIDPDANRKQICWERTTALPAQLADYVTKLPLWVDLSILERVDQFDLNNPDFKKAVNGIVSRFRQVNPEEMLGEEVQQHKRNLRLRNLAVFALAGLTVLSIMGAIWALNERNLAQREARVSNAQRLAVQAESSARDGYPQRGVLLAMEALHTTRVEGEEPPPDAKQAMLTALASIGGKGMSGHAERIEKAVVTPNGQWIITGSHDGSARVWNLAAQDVAQDSWELPGHRGPVEVLAVSPDSHYLLTAGRQGPARMWDLAAVGTQRIPVRELDLSDTLVRTAGCNSRNECLLVEGKPGSKILRIWSLHTEQETKDPVRVLNLEDYDLGFSVDSLGDHHTVFDTGTQWLATDVRYHSEGESGYKTLAWNLEASGTGPPLVLEGGADAVEFSPNGRWLVATGKAREGESYVARLMDLSAGSSLVHFEVLDHHNYFIRQIGFSPDSRWMILGSWDNTATVWDLQNGPKTQPSLVLSYGADSVAIGAGNEWVMTAGTRDFTGNTLTLNNNVHVWNLNRKLDDSDAKPLVLRGHEGIVTAMVFPAGSSSMITTSADATMRLWNLRPPEVAVNPRLLFGHRHEVRSMAMGPNNILVSGAADEMAIVWDLKRIGPLDQGLVKLNVEQDYSASQVALSRNGKWLVTWNGDEMDRSAYLWEMKEIHSAASPVPLPNEGTVLTSAISEDGRWVATAGNDHAVKLWDTRIPSVVAHVLEGHGNAVISLAFTSDGKWLASGGFNGEVRLWPIPEGYGETASLVLSGHGGIVQDLTGSHDSRWLVSGSADKTVRIWDLNNISRNKEPSYILPHEQDITRVEISPDDKWLVASSHTKDAYLYDLKAKDLKGTRKILGQHDRGITAVAFSENSRWLTTASMDNTVRLWDLWSQKVELEPLVLRQEETNPGTISSVAFANGDRWVVAGCSDNLVRIWTIELEALLQLGRATAGRPLTSAEREQYGLKTVKGSG